MHIHTTLGRNAKEKSQTSVSSLGRGSDGLGRAWDLEWGAGPILPESLREAGADLWQRRAPLPALFYPRGKVARASGTRLGGLGKLPWMGTSLHTGCVSPSLLPLLLPFPLSHESFWWFQTLGLSLWATQLMSSGADEGCLPDPAQIAGFCEQNKMLSITGLCLLKLICYAALNNQNTSVLA